MKSVTAGIGLGGVEGAEWETERRRDERKEQAGRMNRS